MNRICVLVFTLLFAVTSIAQTEVKLLKSAKLNETRAIKIQLPRNYIKDKDTKKKYPVCVVLDAEYLFEYTAGAIDYFSYWGDMPETIVVGITHGNRRKYDLQYDVETNLPIEQGAAFFEFITTEVIPYIDEVYKTENFKMIIGHEDTANFINYFLLKEPPFFNAYVALSPELTPTVTNYVSERLRSLNTKLFYYLAATENDNSNIKKETDLLISQLKTIDNDFLKFGSKIFENPTHFTLPTYAIPAAFSNIFKIFQPISKQEYENDIVTLKTSPVEYLINRYAEIETTFGISKKILINDFHAIEAAINKNESFEYLKELSKLAEDEYPETLLSHYYLGRYYESTGDPKKAMKTYRSGYILEEIGGITKDILLDKAEKIKYDFGY